METVLLLACLLDSNNLVDSYLWVLVHHLDSTFLQDKYHTGMHQTSQNCLNRFQEDKDT